MGLNESWGRYVVIKQQTFKNVCLSEDHVGHLQFAIPFSTSN